MREFSVDEHIGIVARKLHKILDAVVFKADLPVELVIPAFIRE